MRISVFGAIASLCLGGLCTAQTSHAAIRKDLNVPSEALAPALQDLARIYDLQLLYHTELAQGLKTKGAIGSLTADEALGRVLTGTGLTFQYLDAQTVTIVPSPQSAASSTQSPPDQGSGKQSTQESLRLAQLDQTGPASSLADQKKPSEPELTEIERCA